MPGQMTNAYRVGLVIELCLSVAGPAPAQSSLPSQQPSYYYCDDLKQYFPNVKTCPHPWRAVPIQATKPATSTAPAATPTPPPGPSAAEIEARKAAAQKVRAAAQEKAREEQEAREARDLAGGYKKAEVADILLDQDKIGGSDKFFIRGYYTQFGKVAFLAGEQFDTNSIVINADELPRDDRKRLLSCSGCRVTLWAHPGCEMTILGKSSSAACLIADRVRF
jgi:hypothetical protein